MPSADKPKSNAHAGKGQLACDMLNTMKLYNYFRSSASFRVRIALNLKGLPYEYIPIHLAKGEHKLPSYAAVSADGLVPLLDDGEHVLNQSMAIIEYLDETHPTPALMPADSYGRARVRALAQSIACEIHPINNLRVLKYLTHVLKVDEDAKNTWYRHWVRDGLEAFERQLAQGKQGTYCYGDMPTLADCCLVPQIFNARRFDTPLDGLSRTMAIFDACMALDAFQKAQPSACPDKE
jgi:maleylacetoacetate isomerase/maleylpyruvate isomerase